MYLLETLSVLKFLYEIWKFVNSDQFTDRCITRKLIVPEEEKEEEELNKI